MDADALACPAEVDRILSLMSDHGWKAVTSFDHGSVFEHAATLFHPQWGTVDLHRHFPGLRREPSDVFELMWEGRSESWIGGQPCAVPDVWTQRLILLTHAARSGAAQDDPDVFENWRALDGDGRSQLLSVARRYDAQVALAAATGDLDSFREDPDYLLWAFSSRGGSRISGWWARIRSARGVSGKVRVIAHIVEPNLEHLELRLGHRPSAGEVWADYRSRLVFSCRELILLMMRRGNGGSK